MTPRRPKQFRRIHKQERAAIHPDALHRVLWGQRNRSNRVVVKVKDLAERYDVGYRLANDAVLELVRTGRMRWTGYAPVEGGVKIYELADPDRWDPDDTSTHSTPARRPLWG